MKKNGFTLAEVLITLAIIGVVATLTLPSLMSNTQEQQSITAFKKAMNTLNEVAQMNSVVDGFDYSGVTTTAAHSAKAIYDANGVLTQSIWAMMKSKAQIDEAASIKGGIPGDCKTYKYQVFFRDGTVLCYTTPTNAGTSQAYIPAAIDTNGLKGPNKVSECGDANCVTKNTKKIYDQYRITLYGSNAVPGLIKIDANGNVTDDTSVQGNAARYAMRK